MFGYTRDELFSMPLISKSHHKVYSDGNVFLKSSRSVDASSEIVLEYTVGRALGREAKLLPGPPVSVLTPKYGVAITELSEASVRDMVRYLCGLSGFSGDSLRIFENLAPDFNDVLRIGREKVASRVEAGLVDKSVLDMMVVSIPRDDSWVLSHGDPRSANWIIEPDSKVSLIDWESAVIAPIEFSIAALATYVYEDGRADLVDYIFDEACKHVSLDSDLVSDVLRFRIALMVSWYYAFEGIVSGNTWLDTSLNEVFREYL